MPEYSHIQTYLKCGPENFKDGIKHFSEVLTSLGLDSKYFTVELEWELSDNGFMYVGGGAKAQLYVNNGNRLHIRPYVIGWTPEVIKELQESWLEVSLLFWTEEIELDWRTGQLKEEHKSVVWTMMEKFSKEFRESGVYFTNEVTDGKPWEALICGKKAEVWTFDAAILPEHLINSYLDSQPEMFTSIKANNMFVARRSVWMSEPWLNY
ncbi:hypothetical protein [Paenibacillus spongiae]|uniref:Uncharacterized protein n=1 Tax=Paenibacillus spongiae TaxID=2909671 RepID=A0ABY5S0Q1_9BACL|nr:hypothetical protein [Paenibacillus spongiae]UVI27427.1 hypothetical protein L1F29_18320 [Paenibacillus spongiae]